mmetsp:Transcript_32006/g.66815  ORF Transcript_32006/g.66815 Transcript_32006/m.66815 type:complete len:371 (-) Transcript_32006:128-1240(-)|eukprot:CAMPEP_0172466586 /NCGR_PEP_ID=MMETSP1065-20121228/56630_1 /TAXON_ID=265537 /ORGANISM="Amphiprora paludosa, Strain CCMP125" /LENGTH=370 /DNA_ID=CAMNT_0013223445 /DNA_START=29 /DNA_END=1141 /DNA_ORIENTATION=+
MTFLPNNPGVFIYTLLVVALSVVVYTVVFPDSSSTPDFLSSRKQLDTEITNEDDLDQLLDDDVKIALASPQPASVNEIKPQQGNWHNQFNSTCIFIYSSPGSGSSTMVKLLEQCHVPGSEATGCTMSGENWGALQHLTEFQQSFQRTHLQPRPDEHADAAWRRVYHYPEVIEAERDLVASLLNPHGESNCWGIKEIRFGRGDKGMESLTADTQFLSSLCANPKFIVHTRRDIQKELNSSIIGGRRREQTITQKQHQCFDTFMEGTKGAPRSQQQRQQQEGQKQCLAPKDRNIQRFRHHLEDYVERNENFYKLWNDFLGCQNPPPEQTLKMKSKSHAKPTGGNNVKGNSNKPMKTQQGRMMMMTMKANGSH